MIFTIFLPKTQLPDKTLQTHGITPQKSIILQPTMQMHYRHTNSKLTSKLPQIPPYCAPIHPSPPYTLQISYIHFTLLENHPRNQYSQSQ